MRVTLFRRTYSVSAARILLGLLVLAFLFGVGAFLRLVYLNYRAIKSGESNPILDRRLESSMSGIRANAAVTAQDMAVLASADAPTLGTKGAKLSIVEFVDYGCPYSKESFPAVRTIMEKYKDRVAFSLRDFPIEELHPRALAAAIAARCAQDQGKFWPYHDQLFANQDHQEDADLVAYAQTVGLDTAAFQSCVSNRTTQPKVEEDMRDALRLGIGGTPTFFFNGVKIQGSLDEQSLDYLVNLFLKTATTTKK